MATLARAKLERHLYAAADRLRQEGLEAAAYKDFIFGRLFLKRYPEVFDAERDKIVGRKVERGMIREVAETQYGENTDFYDGFFVPKRARWAYLQSRINDASASFGNVLDKARGMDPQRLIHWAAPSGPATAQVVETILASRPHPQQGFRSC